MILWYQKTAWRSHCNGDRM